MRGTYVIVTAVGVGSEGTVWIKLTVKLYCSGRMTKVTAVGKIIVCVEIIGAIGVSGGIISYAVLWIKSAKGVILDVVVEINEEIIIVAVVESIVDVIIGSGVVCQGEIVGVTRHGKRICILEDLVRGSHYCAFAVHDMRWGRKHRVPNLRGKWKEEGAGSKLRGWGDVGGRINEAIGLFCASVYFIFCLFLYFFFLYFLPVLLLPLFRGVLPPPPLITYCY